MFVTHDAVEHQASPGKAIDHKALDLLLSLPGSITLSFDCYSRDAGLEAHRSGGSRFVLRTPTEQSDAWRSQASTRQDGHVEAFSNSVTLVTVDHFRT